MIVELLWFVSIKMTMKKDIRGPLVGTSYQTYKKRKKVLKQEFRERRDTIDVWINKSMKNYSYFMGQDGFSWFVGVVEDRDDPHRLGSCTSSWFNYHTEDKTKIPTESLPLTL